MVSGIAWRLVAASLLLGQYAGTGSIRKNRVQLRNAVSADVAINLLIANLL